MIGYSVLMITIITTAAIGSTMDLVWIIKNKSSK